MLGEAVFPAISHSFVKQTGKDTLHPLKELISKDNILPLQVVWKSTKRHFLFREKAYYNPTPFQLKNLLADEEELKVKPEEKPFTGSCKVEGQYSLNGAFGGSLQPVISGGVSVSKNVKLSVNLGQIQQHAVDIVSFRRELPHRKLKMNDNYISSHKNDVLCVITKVLELVGPGHVARKDAVQGNVTVKAKVTPVDGEVNIEAGGSTENEVNICLINGTPLAYELHELRVTSHDRSPEGNLELVLDKNQKGGFISLGLVKGISVGGMTTKTVKLGDDLGSWGDDDIGSGGDNIVHVADYFKPIYSLHEGERNKLTEHLLQLMSVPNDIHTICVELLEKAEDQDSTTTIVCVPELKKKIITPENHWIPVLVKAGFVRKEDELRFPNSTAKDLRAYGTLFDALDLLDDEDLENIRNVSPISASPLLTVMENALQRKSHNDKQTKVLADDTYAKDLLHAMGFSIDEGTITAPVELSSTIDLVYWVVSALWGPSIDVTAH